MKFHVLTLFPEMVEAALGTSITGRAMAKGIICLHTVNIRDFSLRGDGRIDDYPYGGGAGMVMQAEPVMRAWESLAGELPAQTRVICLNPQGRVFDQKMAEELAGGEELVFLCGHYEGIDERVLDEIVTDHVSIGDYVLTGGELPALVMMDAIARMVPGVLSNQESGQSESFQGGLLEYPQYSRPEDWRGKKVPAVLLSGHHANVDRWRRNQSILRTLRNRPELLKTVTFDKKDRKYLQALITGQAEDEITQEQAVFLSKLLAITEKS